MKLRKKLIILSILFLFGFGVFFGTFASGGYLVKAAGLTNDGLNYGTIEEERQTPGGDYYNVKYDLTYNDDTPLGYYELYITFENNVYDFNVDDYFSEIDVIKYNQEDGIIYDYKNTNYGIEPDDMETYYDEDADVIILHLDYIFNEINSYNGIYTVDLSVSNIFLEYGVQNNEIQFQKTFSFNSYSSYLNIYETGYAIGLDEGYDDGYTLGHEDGYDEGYALGETAGYNDGLDIGYYNGYEVGHYDGYTEGEAYGYTTGLDEGYWYGLDEGLQVSGYKEAYDKGIAKAENTASTWFKGLFDGFQRFFNIQLGGISIGAIILIPLSITFAWFIIRQFRGGGGGD